MQLVHMDVSLPGQGARQYVGPLSTGLNAIAGPRGAGKSRLIRWLRQVTADTYGPNYVPPLHPVTDLVGEIEMHNHGVPLRWTRDTSGRVSITEPSHANYANLASSRGQSFRDLSARQRQAFTMLADLCEANDTEANLDDVARRLGIEHVREEYSNLGNQERLLARERELLSRLDALQNSGQSREQLIVRRQELEYKLGTLRQTNDRSRLDPTMDRQRLLDRCASIQADLQAAEAEQRQVDGEIAKVKAELKLCEIGQQSLEIEPSYRLQMQQLEDRLTRWRKTLRDLKSHREAIEHQESEAQLDQQIGTQLAGNLHADPRASMRSLEAQLHQARTQIDQLIYQYWPNHSPHYRDRPVPGVRSVDPRALDGYQVQRDGLGNTQVSIQTGVVPLDTSRLPETLQSMQRDLHEICHQLSRQESAQAAATLKHQTQQLRRCETELLLSVEKLIEERAELLRKIADHYHLTSDQLSLTFGDWCQCHDHPHLHEWLLQDEAPRKHTCQVDGQHRLQLEESLARLSAQRRQAELRAHECRRQLRDAQHLSLPLTKLPIADHRQAEEAELLRALDAVIVQLDDCQQRDRLNSELDEVRRQLASIVRPVSVVSDYRQTVDRNIIGLSGSLYQSGQIGQAERSTHRQYDTFNGVVSEVPAARNQFQVPSAIVRIAQRLSIVQMLASRGESIPLILDQSLDGLDSRQQQAAIGHLALASSRIQVILMTEDAQVAELVRQHQGTVIALRSTFQPRQSLDVNRQLTAYANDEESAKWYQPALDANPDSVEREFYLTPRSPIDLHPGIDANLAERCRACGIHRIGDLLDVDAGWLADNLRSAQVSGQRISNWQSAADLLCSVRHLRPFDARLLVGAGIISAQHLSETHPGQLLARIEQFLATESGRRTLRSGNRFEHSRITNWIAAAKRRSQHYPANVYDRGFGRSTSPTGSHEYTDYSNPDFHRQATGYQQSRPSDHSPRQRRSYEERQATPFYDHRTDRTYANRQPHDYDEEPRDSAERQARNGQSRKSTDQDGYRWASTSGRDNRYDAARRNEFAMEDEPRRLRQRTEQAFPTLAKPVEPAENAPMVNDRDGQRSPRTSKASPSTPTNAVRFYLELGSPVVDAPSIGERMAQRLSEYGIFTVEQLLAANANSLAEQLGNRRITGQTIRTWQDQARLVCRIPFLRGHDAQLLVACDMTTPEMLLSSTAESILAKVISYARTSDGQRVLRGGKEPDLAEVKDWLSWAGQSRNLNAA